MGASDGLRWWRDDVSECVCEGAWLPKDGLRPPKDVLAEADGAGGGRAPVGLLTRLLRRSAKYEAEDVSFDHDCLHVEEQLAHTELVVGHVGRRRRRDLPRGPLLRFAAGKHNVDVCSGGIHARQRTY